jgi:hypothetical protein
MAIGLLASGSYAYASSNTFGGAVEHSGEGSQTISGFDVSAITYTLASDPTELSAVEFTIDGTATDVRAKVLSTSTTYVSCEVVSGTRWTCPITNAVAEVDELAVIAVQ